MEMYNFVPSKLFLLLEQNIKIFHMSIHKTFSPDIRLPANDPLRLRVIKVISQPSEKHVVGVDHCFKKEISKYSKVRPKTTGGGIRINAI
jgi:hypothetical protein